MDILVVVFMSLFVFPTVALILWVVSKPRSSGEKIKTAAVSTLLKAEDVTENIAPAPPLTTVENLTPLQTASAQSPTISDVVYDKYEWTGLKGRIFSAYRDAFMATRQAGIPITQQTTLREYLMSVSQSLPEISEKLAELTDLTEMVLYSDVEPDEKMAERAEELGRGIGDSYK